MYNIAVIFGGESTEHSISIISAFGALKSLSLKFKPVPIYINTHGQWVTGEHLLDSKSFAVEPGGKPCFFKPNDANLYVKSHLGYKKIKIDCALLVLHGGIYEGGAVQSVLELSKIPYTSPSILGSSVCMDKVITKVICEGLGIPVVDYVYGDAKDIEALADKTLEELAPPYIVKPARAGSSVGITKVNGDREKLIQAIQFASHFDTKILVEEALENFRELNIALLKDKDKIRFSAIEEIKCKGELYTFDQKYKSSSTAERIVPAEIDLKKLDKITKLTEKIYRMLDLKGVVRFDIFVVENKVYLNEINTIPGSFSFYLWKNEGLNFAQILNINILDAINSSKTASIPVEYNKEILSSLKDIGNTTK